MRHIQFYALILIVSKIRVFRIFAKNYLLQILLANNTVFLVQNYLSKSRISAQNRICPR